MSQLRKPRFLIATATVAAAMVMFALLIVVPRGGLAEVSAQNAPVALSFYPAETYSNFGSNPAGIIPYGLAIADVVSPFAPYLPDGLPDVAVACNGTSASWDCDAPGGYFCYGRVVIFVNMGDWADDGQSNGLEHFANIDIPIWSHQAESWNRKPYDLRWVDLDHDAPRNDLDLVLTTGGDADIGEGGFRLQPPAAVWAIRNNNCAETPEGRFELLFDEGANWHYPLDFANIANPGLAVADVSGATLPDVIVSSDDGPLTPSLPGKAAATIFENIGGLQMDPTGTVWTHPNVPNPNPVTFGSAVVARRAQELPEAPQAPLLAGADVYMSLIPGSPERTWVMHPSAGCPATMDFAREMVELGSSGHGLAIEEFFPCHLGLVSTFENSLGRDAARVVYLLPDGDLYSGSPVQPLPLPASYDIRYDPSPPDGAWGVAAGRFDPGDLWDFVVAFGSGGPTNHGGIVLFRNNGANPGMFLLSSFHDTDPASGLPTGASLVAVGDLDQDGFDDVVVSNTAINNIAVLINQH